MNPSGSCPYISGVLVLQPDPPYDGLKKFEHLPDVNSLTLMYSVTFLDISLIVLDLL